MNATVVAVDLSAAHADSVLFQNLDLVVAPGDVIGLIGVNGSGKSTLLQMLAGLRPPDQGAVRISPPDATVGYLPQERISRPGETVAQFIARRTGVAAALMAMDQAALALTDQLHGADDRYSAALERWLALGGADLDVRTDQAATEVGLGVSVDAQMSSLSGGQAARAGMASLLLSRFDVVLLDEPTNDLDLHGLDQLEQWVSRLRTAAVVVSHDREFLARTVNRVVELDLAQHVVRQIDGGYAAYLEEREIERRHARQAYDEYAQRREELKQRGQTQRAWMDKGVANARRKATDNDKIGRNFRTEATEKQAAKARQTQRMMERLEEVAEPRKEWQLRMEIASAARSGAVVARLDKAVVRRGVFDDFVLGPIDLELGWAERIALTGANGSGKSTLLALILGRVAPSGGSAMLGSGVIVGEVDQARELFASERSVLATTGAQLPALPDAEVRTLLAKFGLRGPHVNRSGASLSPGERTRASLALLQARGVNLLVLDEPTNHLDLAAIEQLESALESFTGTVLLVTHDRRMLATFRATRRLHLEAGTLSEHSG